MKNQIIMRFSMKKISGPIIFIFLIFAAMMPAESIRIITPYAGLLDNELSIENMSDLKESAFLGGLYFQWVNPDIGQWNVFLYRSDNINYSDIFGGHFIIDYTIPHRPLGQKYIVGTGFDYIQIDTQGEVSPYLSDFSMKNHVYAPYIRGGWNPDFGNSEKKVSVLLWAGLEKDLIRGDIEFRAFMPPGMGTQAAMKHETIQSDETYGLLGINLKTTLYHFLELTAKYHRKFSVDDSSDLDSFTAQCNLYLNRHWGLSYQYKFMEVSVCTNTYHMGGIAFIF
jgi:hypothetical protein